MRAIKIRMAAFDEPAVQELVAENMSDLSQRYGGSGDDTPISAADFTPPRGAFFVAVSVEEDAAVSGAPSGVALSEAAVSGSGSSEAAVSGVAGSGVMPSGVAGSGVAAVVGLSGFGAVGAAVAGAAAGSDVAAVAGIGEAGTAAAAGSSARGGAEAVPGSAAAGVGADAGSGAELPDGERLLGSAGWRRHGDDAELKRMFTTEAARGQGIARRMLATIEESARAAGCRRVILETGSRQPEAIALYISAGYERIEDFGYYKGHAGVLSYAKVL